MNRVYIQIILWFNIIIPSSSVSNFQTSFQQKIHTRRTETISIVSKQSELINAINNIDIITIDLANDIYLNESIVIHANNRSHGFVLNGNYHQVNGQAKYQCFQILNSANQISFKNLMITNCTNDNDSMYSGGGGLILAYSKILLLNCTFSQNILVSTNSTQNGAAILSTYSELIIINSIFSLNTIVALGGYGGSIVASNSIVNITNSTISSSNITSIKSSTYGGGLAVIDSSLLLKNSVIKNNVLVLLNYYADTSNTYELEGVGVMSSDSLILIENTDVYENQGYCGVGDNHCKGSGMAFINPLKLQLTQCHIYSNYLESRYLAQGSGLYIKNSPANSLIHQCHFNQNIINSHFASEISNIIGEYGSGAGVFIIDNSTLNVTSSVFASNQILNTQHALGAGFSVFNSHVHFINNSFDRNKIISTEYQTFSIVVGGGGIYGDDLSQLDMFSCLFKQNVAVGDGGDGSGNSVGGAVAVGNSRLLLISCYFYANVVKAGTLARGGAVSADYSTTTIIDCHFLNQTVDATYTGGGAVLIHAGNLTVKSSIIEHNKLKGIFNAFGGGFQFFLTSFILILDSIIMNNFALSGGGGLIAYQSLIHVINSTISNNTTPGIGGGIISMINSEIIISNSLIESNYGGSGGGGVYLLSSSTGNFTNCSLAYNKGFSGGGFYISGTATYCNIQFCLIHHNEVLENSGGGIFVQSGEVNIESSLILYNKAVGLTFAATGSCNANHGCFTSPNYPDDYSLNTECNYTALGDGKLNVVFFDIQPMVTDYVKEQTARLFINNVAYSGIDGPDGVSVSKGEVFQWNAPDFVQYPGFEICYSILSSGGGLYIENGNVLLWETTIAHNEATQYGAGIYSTGSVYAVNCDISFNYAWDGGAAYIPSGNFDAINLILNNNSVATNATYGTTYPNFGGNGVSAVSCESPCLAGEYGICSHLDFVSCPHNCRCEKCPIGKASKTIGATSITTCVACSAGFIASFEGSSSCENCPIGKFAANISDYNQSSEELNLLLEGASWCGDCFPGTIARNKASIVCQVCDGNFYSHTGASECRTCKENYYYDNSECIKCMDGVNCNINGLSTLKTLNLEQGYWRSNFNSSQILSCSLKKACKGGMGVSSIINNNNDNDNNDGFDYSVYCFNGYIGPLCNVCDQNYYYWNGECLTCTQNIKKPLISFLVLCLVFSLVLITYKSIHHQDNETKIFIKTTLKIIFVTFQILVSIPDVFEFTFPSPYDELLNFLSMFSFQISDFFALSCYTETDFYDLLLFTCLVPILLCFLLFLFQLIYVQYHSICFSIGLLLLYLNCPIASVTIFKTYSCKSFDDHTNWLRADYSLNCDANIHEKYEIFAVFMILIWPIGVPCLFLSLFYHYREFIQKSLLYQQQTLKQVSYQEEISGFSFLFEGFLTNYYFWEFVILIRRIFLIGVLVVLSQHPVWQHLSAIFLCIGSMVLTAHYWPYESLKINVFALACEMMITFTIIVGTVGLLSPNWFESSYAGIILAVGAGLIVTSSILLINYEVIQSNYQYYHHHQHQHYIKIEYAVEFTNNKFITTLSSVHHNHISRGNVLVYYYCHLELAELIIEIGGFPVTSSEGVYFTLTGPHALPGRIHNQFNKQSDGSYDDDNDDMKTFFNFFKSCEVVLACSIPAFLIEPSSSSSSSSSFVCVPTRMIQRMGGRIFKTNQLNKPNSSSLLMDSIPSDGLLLPSECIERAYRLSLNIDANPISLSNVLSQTITLNLSGPDTRTSSSSLSSSSSSSSSLSSSLPTNFSIDSSRRDILPTQTIHSINRCSDYVNHLLPIRNYCSEQSLTLLYHYTQPILGPSILENGFRMSTQGQGDGGVYFSTLGPISYGLGTDDYEINIIKDCFGVERIDEYQGAEKLDLVLVCAIEAGLLEQAPGGRDNAKMISKTTFRTLSVAHKDRCYYCPPNCIVAACLIPAIQSNKMLLRQCPKLFIENEIENDKKIKTFLNSLKLDKKEQINSIMVKARNRLEEQSDEDNQDRNSSLSTLPSSTSPRPHIQHQENQLNQTIELVSRRISKIFGTTTNDDDDEEGACVGGNNIVDETTNQEAIRKKSIVDSNPQISGIPNSLSFNNVNPMF